MRSNSEQLALLEEWMRSYHPEELFDAEGKLIPELAALAPEGQRRMGSSPHANGGRVLKDLDLPDFRDYAVEVSAPAKEPRGWCSRCGARDASPDDPASDVGSDRRCKVPRRR